MKQCFFVPIKGVFTLTDTETETDATTETESNGFNANMQNCSHYQATETNKTTIWVFP